MSGPFFSVATVVLNDREGLRKTAASVKAQTYLSREWVVVDGASSDGTADLVKTLGADRWLSERDGGIYDAMNKAAGLAGGEYMVFLNAGDTFPSPDTLSSVAGLLSGGVRPDVLFGGAMLIFPSGRRRYRPPRLMESGIWHGLPAMHQATYYRRDRILPRPYDPSYRICGDYDIAARLHRDGAKAGYAPFSLVEFRVGDTSYRHPFQNIRESIRVQRNILRLGWPLVLVSAARRVLALAAVAVLALLRSGERTT